MGNIPNDQESRDAKHTIHSISTAIQEDINQHVQTHPHTSTYKQTTPTSTQGSSIQSSTEEALNPCQPISSTQTTKAYTSAIPEDTTHHTQHLSHVHASTQVHVPVSPSFLDGQTTGYVAPNMQR